jgi:phytol kinase
MISLAFVVAIVFFLILLGEFMAQRNQNYPEFNRKFVHITVGSFVAFWPLILTWNQIIFLSAAFVLVISISKSFNILKSIHGVKRATWGEVYFGLIVGLLALITQDGWIYMVALLHMSLADGMAAVIGMRYGKRLRYTVFGSLKSLLGTSTFFVISIILLFGYALLGDPTVAFLPLVGLAAAATVLENAGMRGLDNLTVPIIIALGLITLSA